MKIRSIRRLALAIAAVALLGATSASAAQAFDPYTHNATKVTQTTAQLNGLLATFQQRQEVTYAFEYGKTPAFGSETAAKKVDGFQVYYNVSEVIAGLELDTTYYYRIGGYENGGTIKYGETRTFKTPPAARFQADSYPASLSGSVGSGTTFKLVMEGGLEFACKAGSFSGSLSTASATVDLDPNLTECSLNGIKGTVAANGCKYVVQSGELIGGPGTFGVSCPAGKAIEVTSATCGLSLPAQSGLSSIAATNDTSVSPQKVNVAINASGVTYTKSKDGFLCPFAGTGTLTNGSYTGTIEVGAKNSGGSPIGLRVG